MHLPLSVRQQIWRGEFINLSILLKGAIELNEICSPATLSITASGSLTTKPKECKDKVPNIEKWTDAFIIFMSIYILEHKDQASELLKYVNLIKEFSVTKKSFILRCYDEQFRTRQAYIPSPWGSMNLELLYRCTPDPDAQPLSRL